MIYKKIMILICCFCFYCEAFANSNDGLGQVIQINTRFNSFVGKPSWLLIVRDIDHGQNIPYLFDISTGKNIWIVFTYSQNYLITVSNLQFSPYTNDPYRTKRVHNFCHLESNGRILHGQSIAVTIKGSLTPYADSYECFVSTYQDDHFSMTE